ncbi:hypothetical protein BU26DRAFT_406872, partial [Trematosphaeria pertusa]
VREEASWLLYNKVVLHLDARQVVSYHDGTPAGRAAFEDMWMSVASYRFVELTVPAEFIRQGKPEDCTFALSTAARQLIDHWEIQPLQPSGNPPHLVTVRFGAMFKEGFPSTHPERVLKHVRAAAWSNLETMIKRIAAKDKSGKWTFTAMSEIKSKKTGGRYILAKLEECARANGIQFKCLSTE